MVNRSTSRTLSSMWTCTWRMRRWRSCLRLHSRQVTDGKFSAAWAMGLFNRYPSSTQFAHQKVAHMSSTSSTRLWPKSKKSWLRKTSRSSTSSLIKSSKISRSLWIVSSWTRLLTVRPKRPWIRNRRTSAALTRSLSNSWRSCWIVVLWTWFSRLHRRKQRPRWVKL